MSTDRFAGFVFPASIFVISVICLLVTAYPSIAWWDAGHYAAMSVKLGAPSPGGSIIYLLLGRLAAVVFFFMSPVKAVTMVSVLSTALAAVLLYFSLLTILRDFPSGLHDRVLQTVSFITALCVPYLYSIWIESYATRVYNLGLLLTAAVFFCVVEIWIQEDIEQKSRYFLFVVFLLVIDFAAHRLSSPFYPVMVLLLLFTLRPALKSVRFWLTCLVLVSVGLSIFAYLLIRPKLYTPVDYAEISNVDGLISWIGMSRYGGGSNLLNLFNRRAPLWAYQIDYMYLRYFGWNFLGSRANSALFGLPVLSVIPPVLGLFGLVYCLLKKTRTWLILFCTWICFSIVLILYLNVVDGFHNIREIDRLYIPSFYLFLIWIGIGVYAVSSLLLSSSRFRNRRFSPLGYLLTAIGLVALPMNICLSNWRVCDRHRYSFPADFAYNLLNSCERNGILITNGDNDTYPLWYLQSIEGVRTDVSVINVNLLNTDFYLNHITRGVGALALDAELVDQTPTGPILLEKPLGVVLPPPEIDFGAEMPCDSLRFAVDGVEVNGKRILRIQDMALLSMLRNNAWKRPIYFAVTVNRLNRLGMDDYLTLAGLTFRVMPEKDLAIKVDEIDVEKFLYGAFADPDVFIEPGTVMLYNNMRYLYVELARYYLDRGDRIKAASLVDEMNTRLPKWRFPPGAGGFVESFEARLSE